MGSINAASKQTTGLFFEILSHVDPSVVGPRLARFALKARKQIETPNFFAVGSRGVIPHITPDVVTAHTQIGGVHMALEDFIERSTPPILNCPGPSPLHTFTTLPKDHPILLAPRRTPAVSAPNGNSNSAISVFTSTGFQTLSNKSYLTYITALHPDIAISLADIPHGAPPGTKRIAKMGNRTQDWLTQLMNEKLESQVVFAPVLPIDFHDQSEYLHYVADDLAGEISGLAFYDSNLLPDIPQTTSVTLLPRLSLDEPTSPRQILRQISLGMDLFTIPFIGFATDAGIALTFSFPRPLTSTEEPIPVESETGTTLLPLGLDIWSPTHSTSLLPLSPCCNCYACTSHHRAYIQHLLSAKEMLGWVLLQIHNLHTLSEFFSDIRKSIAEGRFEEDCQVWEGIYESELPEKSGQGPRARGYHFKSEGPGEKKKNKPAWENMGPDAVEGGGSGSITESGGSLAPSESGKELEEKGFAERIES